MPFLMKFIKFILCGRTPRLLDVCIDMCGVLIGLVFAYLIFNRKKLKKHKDKDLYNME